MANVDKSQLHDYVNGETVDETKLDQNFEVLRIGANDTNTKVNTITSTAALKGTNSDITSMTGVTGGISSPDFVQFDTTAGATSGVAKLNWNATDGTLEFGLVGGNVTLQVGQEEVLRVLNNTAGAMTNGQVVYITGASGQRPTVALANAGSEATSSKTIGVLTEDIAVNQQGFVTMSGIVRDINTSAYAEGSALWLATTSGGITTTRPVAPNHGVLVGFCIRSHATQGQILVKVQNGFELDEVHDVLIGTKADGDFLVYESSSGLWKNKTRAALNLASQASPTFTGTVTVPTPTNTTDAANKGYVDAQVTALDGATQTGLGLKVNKSGDTMTGPLTLPGAPSADLHASTKKYVDDQIYTLTNGSPALLNTLDELAAALGDDPNFATTMTNQLALKAPIASPTFTGTVTVPGANVTGNIDMNKNQIVELVFEKLASAPADPIESQAYYNTVTKQFLLYKGAALGWVDLSGQGALIKDKEFTATSGQTVFDLSDVATYVPGTNAITVYINGILQSESTYVETSSTVVTLNSGATAGAKVYFKWFYQDPAFLGSVAVKDGTLQTNLNADLLDGQHASAFAPINNPTFTGTVNLPSTNVVGTLKLEEAKELVRVLALTPTNEPNIEVLSGAVVYFTSANTANFTLNFKGNVSTTMNSFLASGESTTVTVLVTNGATAYYPNVIQIDGTAVTPKWNGGTAISAGNPNSIDAYTFTIIKTASATYTVLASQAKFA